MLVDRESDVPMYRQVYLRLRERIEAGVLAPGTKLPALRTLAADLGVARNTVEAAYNQLVLEGYLRSKRGSGYVVEDLDFSILNSGALQPDEQDAAGVDGVYLAEHRRRCTEYDDADGCAFNFGYGNRNAGAFPAEQWRSCVDDALMQPDSDGADSYTEAFGLWGLRCALTQHLKVTRGVRCTPEQVVIVPGTQAALDALITLFDHDERTVCMEDPGYYAARATFESRGCDIVPIPVHGGVQGTLDELRSAHGNLLWLTPSNQFPLGFIMPLKARLEAIEWAEREDAFVIEDDYCCEFRYGSQPILSMQSLDTSGRVVYLGTMSKILSPALRMSFLVLPPALVERWYERSPLTTSAVPWVSQKALHLFMTRGKWNSYVRGTVRTHRTRRDLLVGSLKREFGQEVELLGHDAGQHLVVRVKGEREADELIGLAREQGVRVYSLGHCWASADHPLRSCLLLGYSSIEDEKIPEGVARLRKAWAA